MAIVEFMHFRGKAYAIQDETTKLFFIWCYQSETFAEFMASRLRIDNPADQAANWRSQLTQLCFSERDSINDY